MKPMTDAECRRVEQRLDAAYSVGGREALAKMTGIESYVLYAGKMADLNAVGKRLQDHPHDELGQLRKAKLECEVADIAGWMKEQSRKDRGLKMER